MKSAKVIVTKNNIAQVACVDADMPPLGEGAARLRVESFAVTANNVTYAVIGDMFGYWNFFPTAEDGQGIVPMWGHAVVEASNHPELKVGERLYGYLPMARHLDVIPSDVSPGQFRDSTAHRQPMSPFYNMYSRLAADLEHDPAREDARMIFGPLFKTGFLIEAMFRRENWYGAEACIMTSASSKTALALAHCIGERSPGVRRIGLTSPRNLDFVKSTGLYEEVLDYANLCELAQKSAVSVDFAGNAAVLRTIHETLGDQLKYSCLVGATHIGARGGSSDPMPGPAPILFFAPDHATATVKDMGPKGFAQAVGGSWQAFVAAADGFVSVDHLSGLEAGAKAFIDTVKGKADPACGIIVKP